MVNASENMEITPGRQLALDTVERMRAAQLLRFGPTAEVTITEPPAEITPEELVEQNVYKNNPGYNPFVQN